MEEKDGDCRSTGDDGGWGTRKVRHPLGASITPLVIYGPGLIHTLVVFRGYSTLALHHVDRPATKTTFDLDRFSFLPLFWGSRFLLSRLFTIALPHWQLPCVLVCVFLPFFSLLGGCSFVVDGDIAIVIAASV